MALPDRAYRQPESRRQIERMDLRIGSNQLRRLRQRRNCRDCVAKLAADMQMNAADIEIRIAFSLCQGFAYRPRSQAELRAAVPGRYVRMGIRSHFGIETQRHLRLVPANSSRCFIYVLQLALILDIKPADAALRRQLNFRDCLADSREYDVLCSRPGLQRADDLASAHGVDAGAIVNQRPQDDRVAIGFCAVMYARADRFEGASQTTVILLNALEAVKINRCLKLPRDGSHRQIVDHQPVIDEAY